MKVTISGIAGSGKSTIADFISKEFNLKRYSGGDFMRELARKKGMTLLELSKIAEKSFEVDKEIDEMYKELGKKDNFVIDSRLGFYFLNDSIKIFLLCNTEVASKRIFEQKRGIEKENINFEKTLENTKRRIKSERIRYMNYYNLDIDNLDNYDIVIDTSDMAISEMNNNVAKAIKSFIH
jgi:CMP/dCMP kinase